MTYPPECIAAFEKAVVETKALLSLHKHSKEKIYTSTRTSDALQLFAHNWERVKELENALAALLPFTDDLRDEGPWNEGWQSDALVAARGNAIRLLEKGND